MVFKSDFKELPILLDKIFDFDQLKQTLLQCIKC